MDWVILSSVLATLLALRVYQQEAAIAELTTRVEALESFLCIDPKGEKHGT